MAPLARWQPSPLLVSNPPLPSAPGAGVSGQSRRGSPQSGPRCSALVLSLLRASRWSRPALQKGFRRKPTEKQLRLSRLNELSLEHLQRRTGRVPAKAAAGAPGWRQKEKRGGEGCLYGQRGLRRPCSPVCDPGWAQPFCWLDKEQELVLTALTPTSAVGRWAGAELSFLLSLGDSGAGCPVPGWTGVSKCSELILA